MPKTYDMAKTSKTPETRTEQPMYVRLPTELHEAVKTRSQADERTMAQTIRLALRYYLQNTHPVAQWPSGQSAVGKADRRASVKNIARPSLRWLNRQTYSLR